MIKEVGRFRVYVGSPYPVWVSLEIDGKTKVTTLGLEDVRDLLYIMEFAMRIGQDKIAKVDKSASKP